MILKRKIDTQTETHIKWSKSENSLQKFMFEAGHFWEAELMTVPG